MIRHRRQVFRKRRPPVGSPPGTLMLAEDAQQPRMKAIWYSGDEIEELDVVDAEHVRAVRDRGGVLWLDVQGNGDRAVLEAIAAEFAVHPLALEDIVHASSRPKTESYEENELFVARMVKLDPTRHVDVEQVCIIIGRSYVLTFQERHGDGDVFDPIRQRLRQGIGPMRSSGADYLAYALIDTIVDYYYPAMEAISDEMEVLEQRVMVAAEPATLVALNGMKRTLLDLRRGIWPQRDAINALVRGDSRFICEGVRLYLRDTYDHAVQVTDLIETYREIAGGLMGTYLSVVSNRTNEIMKVLTIMASIFIPLTFVVGIYGMNFDSMPELRWRYGYPAVMAVMALLSIGMLHSFWRRGWLGLGRGAASRADRADGAGDAESAENSRRPGGNGGDARL